VADVFISHSRLDRERVKPVADRLVSLGYSIRWQDTDVQDVQIEHREREIDAASAVLVMWSANAHGAPRVYGEAASGFDRGKLLQARLDATAPPPPFDEMRAADLSGVGEWGPLEQALSDLIKHDREPAAAPHFRLGIAPTTAAAGTPKLVTLGIALSLAAFVSALHSGVSGALQPSQLQIALVGILGVAVACAGLSANRLMTGLAD
jgi:hypothetical protein